MRNTQWNLMLLVFVFAGGCAQSDARPRLIPRNGIEQANTQDSARIERDVMNFADTYVASVAGAYDVLSAPAATPAAKNAALARKLGAVRGAYSNAVNPNPMAGLVDMVVLTSLQRQVADDPWFAETFGAAAKPVRDVLAKVDADAWSLAGRYLNAQQLDELRASIAHWRRENPGQIRVESVRILDLPEAKEARSAGRTKPGSIFDLLFIDPLAGVEPAAREIELTRATASRMFFYMQRMPEMVRWEAELLYSDMLAAPEMRDTLRDVNLFTANTTKFTDACKEVAAAVARFSKELTVEREKAIVQLDTALAKQRDTAISEVAKATAKEREAAINQVAVVTAKERDAALKQVQGILEKDSKQIIDQAMATISREREAAVKQAAEAVRAEQRVIMADLESTTNRLIDRLAWRAGIAVTAGGAVVVMVWMVCRRWGVPKVEKGG